MFRASRHLVYVVLGLAWLWGGPTWAGDIFVYQASNGSRLITDHPRIEPGYRLVKVYSESDVWNQTGSKRRASFKPRPSSYDNLIRNVARRVSVDPMLIKSVMHAESAFNPNAVSHKGASGLMQLMPATAKRYGVASIFDPRQNVMGGARYLSYLLELFKGNLELVLAGYNAGENAVMRTGGIPPYDETRRYVKKVMKLYSGYRNDRCQDQIDESVGVTGTVISCSGSPALTTSVSNLDVSAEGTTVSSADQSGWRHLE